MASLPAFILSAGYGTRMGEVGKILPKPLWPLGERPILEFVLRQAQRYGQDPLWINLHHQAALVRQFVATLPFSVRFSEEPHLLGSGGGIHQMLFLAEQQQERPPFLALANADQVVWWQPDQHPWPKLQEIMAAGTARAVLLALKVARTQGFNRLILEQDRLKDIALWAKDGAAPRNYLTYLGLGLLRSGDLVLRPKEVSNFFTSVANYQKEEVRILATTPDYYFDLGTATHYAQSFFQLLKLVATQPTASLAKFLIEEQFINPHKLKVEVNAQGAPRIFYGQVQAAAEVQFAANLTDHEIYFQQNGIVLPSTDVALVAAAGIYYQNACSLVENFEI